MVSHPYRYDIDLLFAGHGVVRQRWRDKYGEVEVKAAPQDRTHVEEVRLLDDVYIEDVSHR